METRICRPEPCLIQLVRADNGMRLAWSIPDQFGWSVLHRPSGESVTSIARLGRPESVYTYLKHYAARCLVRA